MKNGLLKLALAAATLPFFSAMAHAHHSFAAEFERDQSVEFTGTVIGVDWTNPHARMYVDAADPDVEGNEIYHWNIELISASILMRQGWRRDTVKVGDTVTVKAWRARKDPHVVNANSVVDAKGERKFSRLPDQTN